MVTQGEQSNGQGKRKNESGSLSEMSQNTIDKIKRSRTHAKSDPFCTYHDMNSPGYGWLLPGWVAEERYMQSGRIYRVIITLLICLILLKQKVDI